MSHNQPFRSHRLPAPCIIDTGVVVDKRDMRKLLADLSHVHYIHTQDGIQLSEGDGCVLEVFLDTDQATLIANHTLYINVCSFDYLELGCLEDERPCFDLVQEGRQLRLIPLSNPLQEQETRSLNAAALEAVVAEVLSANWDMQIDDEEHFSF